MDFLSDNYKAWIQPHKGAVINWSDNKLVVEYKKELGQTSAGFRVETSLAPNQTYQLEISAKLLEGSPAFVYVEDNNQQRLVNRFKIYNNVDQAYRLKHNFITNPITDTVYLGILFYFPDQDYKIEIDTFKIQKVEKLTQANLNHLLQPNKHPASDLASTAHPGIDHNSGRNNGPIGMPGTSVGPKNIGRANVGVGPNALAKALPVQPQIDLDQTNITYPSVTDLHSSWLDATVPIQPVQNTMSGIDNMSTMVHTDGLSSSMNQMNMTSRGMTNGGSVFSLSQPERNYFGRTVETTSPGSAFGGQSMGDFGQDDLSNPDVWSESELANKPDDPLSYIGGGYQHVSSPSPFATSKLAIPKKVDDLLNERAAQSVLPQRITRSLLERLKHFLKQQDRRIVVSLTTTPTRIGKVRKVVDSLLAQSLPISELYLIIPQRYKRSGKPYLISKNWYFKTNPKVRIFRTGDVGPMTKLHPLLEHVDKNTILLTADDDHIYPKHWAVYLSYLAITKPNFKASYSFKGYLNNKVIKSQQTLQPINLDWFCGDWGVCISRKWIRNEAKMLKQISYSVDARYSDDVLTSNHLAGLGVARILLPKIRMPDTYPKALEWSSSYDSLHRMNPRQGLRYLKTCEVLKERHYYNLDNSGPRFKVVTTTRPDGTPKEQPVGQRFANVPEPRLQVLNPMEFFRDKRVRYISYLDQITHPEWVLLYLKSLPSATLELPKVDLQKTSLSQDYINWVGKSLTNYDCIIVDVPFCTDRLPIQIKQSGKPVFYIYRFPEIGNWKIIPHPVIVSQRSYGGHHYWRPELDLQIKNVNLRWNTDHKHLALVISQYNYLANLDFLFDFWNNHCQDLKVTLHLCVVHPMNEKIQALINELHLSNIRVYNQSRVFGTVIYNADYYFQPGFFCDFYALWAHRKQKSLISLKCGTFDNLQNQVEIPYTLGKIQLCRNYLFESHADCQNHDPCAIYGHREAENIPVINPNGLKNLFYKLFQSKSEIIN